ncbi:hypothetical protein FOC1_g10001879 [Fusarium oxysporum f. sp. cubense race 1]|uniref:CCHC-type domain-containing protein n=1 Tax=Fusarium oxysporum f. sp. cubense (strain race 1) TaxID=1229664 RepID=N4UEM0_FUSC1|nr:hypothetical protein FOC1_g10001879 [Fusarium oxysporum f. sp. cubense race 1]
MVFQAFCTKFEEAAQQFTTGPHRRFAQQFADSFLDSWKRELSSAGPTIPKPTYSSVAAASPRTDRDRLTHRQPQQHGRRQTDPPHRQGQQRTIAPPRQDLRVFIRLEAGAPARAHSSYAIRTLIQEKLGAVSNKIRQVFQEWFTYVVSDFPTRLTDFHGKEVDSDSIVSDEIEIQTGLKPIDIRPSRQFSDNPLTKTLLVSFLKPIKRFWSLFGSSAARLIDKTDRPRQCETCWGYHFARNCHRQPVCQRCGKTGHIIHNCTAPEHSAEESARRAPPTYQRATRTCPDRWRGGIPTTTPGTTTRVASGSPTKRRHRITRTAEHSWSKSSGIRSTLVHHGGHKPSGGLRSGGGARASPTRLTAKTAHSSYHSSS